MATTWVRPVRRVSLKAASLASAPELVKNTLPPPAAGPAASSRSASATCGSVAKKFETWPSVPQLPGDRLDQRRVGVAERVDRDAAEQVEVAVAVGVPDVGALAALQHQLRRAEGVHQRGGVALLQVGRCGEPAVMSGVLPCGADRGRATPGSTWVPTPVVGEDLQQHRVRLAAVDDGGAGHAAR